VNALLKKEGVTVVAGTRNPDSDKAKALKEKGAEVVKLDPSDKDSVSEAAKGTDAIYAVFQFWSPDVGYDGEVTQGKQVVDVVKTLGIHLVFASVGAAEKSPKAVRHFHSKVAVEDYAKEQGISFASVRPAFFMENLGSPFSPLKGSTLTIAIAEKTKLQMVATKDIGTVAAELLTNPEKYNGRIVELSSDEVSGSEAAKIIGEALEKDLSFYSLDQDIVKQNAGEDASEMFRFFDESGYVADIKALNEEFGPLTDLKTWATENKDLLKSRYQEE